MCTMCVNSACRGGAYGTVCVHYTTYAVDTVKEATEDGSDVLDYYNSPLSGTPLPLAAQTGTGWDVTSLPNPLEVCKINKKHLKNVGPIRYCEPFYIVIHQGSLLPPLSHAACASMSTTTTTTTTTRDRGDRSGSMEWAQS